MIDNYLNSIFLISSSIFLGFIAAYLLFKLRIKKLKSLACSDDLGIFNHHELNKRINSLIKNPTIKSFAYILIDIDRFKNYNDNYGYDKADKLLQEFVDITKNFIRKSDMFFRYKHGDEFTLVFNNVGVDEAKEIANRLRRLIASHPFKTDNNYVNLTISMGITISFKNDSAVKIKQRAEVALHEARQSKNTVVLIEGQKKQT